MGLRHAAALALIAASSAAASAPQAGPTTDHALTLARTYLLVWHDTLASLVAEEVLKQDVIQYRPGFVSGQVNASLQRRTLRSEVLLLRAPVENVWLLFRDVMAVDGKAVNDRQKRFDDLFSGPAAALLATAERIEEEGFRYNLGSLKRTVNTPLAPLVFLEPRFHANTRWALDRGERLEGRRAWRLRFEQDDPPYSIRVYGSDPPISRGAYWLDPDTGAILQADLRVRTGKTRFGVAARYERVPSIREGMVPVWMREEYDAPRLERLRGVATYANHRLFRTAGRIIVP